MNSHGPVGSGTCPIGWMDRQIMLVGQPIPESLQQRMCAAGGTAIQNIVFREPLLQVSMKSPVVSLTDGENSHGGEPNSLKQ